MKWILILFGLCLFRVSYAQNEIDIDPKYSGFILESDWTRIGLGISPLFFHQKNQHEFLIGPKFYTLNYVLEKSYPGLSIGYFNNLRGKKKWTHGFGFQFNNFFEAKSTANLWVSESLLRFRLLRDLKSHDFNLGFIIGAGPVINYTNTSSHLYLQYEFGITMKAVTFKTLW